jgi:UDP-N-acetylmuramate dehydrogenase
MPIAEETLARLAGIPNLTVSTNVPLAGHTRFGIGGPADFFAEAASEQAFTAALDAAHACGIPAVAIGGGTNLIVSDGGFRGMVLRYRGDRLSVSGTVVTAEAGAELQSLVDFTIARGLGGLETLAGIPGSAGAAVYGNAGAYGHSISERIVRVRFHDGLQSRCFGRDECGFEYRESVFKRRKGWIVFSFDLDLEPADAGALRETADGILRIRNEKFPVTMKCAGSVFKNLFFKDLPPEAAALVPPSAVREGKVAAAWFLERAGAKGMARGDIHVADYHANLIYNGGSGTAGDLRTLIQEMKTRVREAFGIELQEEVQYIG